MTQGKPRDAREERLWRQWIAAWQASGSGVRVFCARHGLAELLRLAEEVDTAGRGGTGLRAGPGRAR